METLVMAESGDDKRTIHFRIGIRRDVRTIRLGDNLLVEVDTQSRLAGFWMLNIPPHPSP
jgi:hypothetical protein